MGLGARPPRRDPEGNLLGVEGVVFDVCDLHRRNRELEAAERRLEALTEQDVFGPSEST